MVTNIHDTYQTLAAYFSPKVIAEVNDQYIKLAKIKGDAIPWHSHEQEDECFIILAGELLMELEGEPPFTMTQGDVFVVKKGVTHRVSSKAECRILLVESKTTAHTGKVLSDITKSIQDQLQ